MSTLSCFLGICDSCAAHQASCCMGRCMRDELYMKFKRTKAENLWHTLSSFLTQT